MIITKPEKIGILTLSSTGRLINSASVAPNAPKNEITGLIKNNAYKNVLIKHAIAPSRLFLVKLNFLFPKVMPTNAAKVSPIDKNDIERNAISAGKNATQTIDEVNKNEAPLKV